MKSNPGLEKCDIVVVMSTATPAKFPTTLEKARIPAQSAWWMNELAGREEKKLFLNRGEDWEQILRDTISSSAGFIN